MFDHDTYAASALNASVTSFNITSFDLTLNYNGSQYVENITGQNLTAGQSYEASFASQVTLVGGANPATVTLSNVNGGADDDASDDEGCTLVNPIVPAPGKW